MNESDYDTEPPPPDDSYLEDDEWYAEDGGANGTDGDADEASPGDATAPENGTADADEGNTTLSEDAFDTGIPAADEGFLDDPAWLENALAEHEDDSDDAAAQDAPGGPRNTPSPTAGALVGLAGAAAGLARRRG